MSTQTSFIPPEEEFHPADFTVQCDLATLCKALARDGASQFPLEIVTYREVTTPEKKTETVIHRRFAYAQLLDNGAICIDVVHLPR